MLILLIFAAIASAYGAIPGDINGDRVVSQDELSIAENLQKNGNISSDQLAEITHIKENYPRTIVDCVNRTITIYKPISRIIAFGGYDAELISLLGDEEKIVGVPNYFQNKDFNRMFFPSLVNKTAPGSASSPDFEMILKLSPDLISCWHSSVPKLEEQIPENITLAGFDLYYPDEFIKEARNLAYILEREGKLDHFINDYYTKNENHIKDRTEGLSDESRPRVYWERQKPYEAYGGQSYITQMIKLAGGKNILSDDNFDIQVIDAEQVVKNNPDIIIRHASTLGPEMGYSIENASQAKALRDSIIERPELADTNAVKNGRVYILYQGLATGISEPIGLAYAAKIIQPDLFRDLDPQEVARDLLSEYLGMDFDFDHHGVLIYPPLEE
jgi:iron complex transport system substrate-binding protein